MAANQGIDLDRREEILNKLAESQFRSQKLQEEIEEKRQRLADMRGRLAESSLPSKREIAEKAKRELRTTPRVVIPEPEPEIDIEDTPEYKAQLEAVQREVDEQAAALAAEIQAKCRVDIDDRMKGYKETATNAFEGKMDDVQTRYRSHAHEAIKGRSTGVLRTNKVIRDISRDLGVHWKPVFLHIMQGIPTDVVDAEVRKLENERGFIQAYKALTIWKDMKGENINVSDLVNALRNNDLYDLAEKALDILETDESDRLIAVSDFGKGIKSASAERTLPGRPEHMEGEDPAAAEEANAKAATAAREARERLGNADSSAEARLAGALGDRKLLALSRKIGNNWVPLAKALEIPKEDIQDIYNAEGDSYQGAFKTIYFWKDNSSDDTQTKVRALEAALRKIEKNDLADELLK